MFQRLISTTATWVTLPLRLALGVVFIAHGAQLVFGTWGGPGLRGFASFPAPFAFMKPAWLWMGAAALLQLVGGALVFVGLLTRLGAFLLACVMLTAMFGVHWGSFFMQSKPPGVEFNVALIGISLSLLIAGGGSASLDRALQDPRARRR